MTEEKEQEKKPRVKHEAAKKDSVSYRTVGRRKEATARVFLTPGKGMCRVNEKEFEAYVPLEGVRKMILAPLTLTSMENAFDISVKVAGGGSRGQAEAIRHGIARALLLVNPDLRKTLRSEGFLTRDPRVKERKKPGLKRARRAPQWQKR